MHDEVDTMSGLPADGTMEFTAPKLGKEPKYAHRVRAIFLVATILVSAFLTWSVRFSINVDGLSYLDIADAYWRRDWGTAINAYWSPLYSWVLGLGLWALRPSSYWQFPVVQFVNFLISLVALRCFDYFWFRRDDIFLCVSSDPSNKQYATFPSWAWMVLGYTLFIWTITRATIVSVVTPDLLLAALVYLAAGLIVRIRAGHTGFKAFSLLGVVLGLGYLCKAAMFVFAFVFFGVSFLAGGNPRKASARVLAALALFLVISSPFIIAISWSKGRFTIGDTAKINYAWGVNQSAPFFNWQGGDPAAGTPRHSTRKLLSVPALYEFVTPIGGTYPPHYDPSYWNEGLTPRLRFWQQARALVTSSYSFYTSFFLPQSGLIAMTILVLLLGGSASATIRRIAENWHLWVPGCAAIAMYALVTLEHRYVGPFVLLIWAAVLPAIRLQDSAVSRKILTYVTLIAAFTLFLSVAEQVGTRLYEWKERSTNRYWEVEEGLHRLGIQPGDKVASLGTAYNAYWARLARVKVVAEIPSSEVETFWAASDQVKSNVFTTCAQMGVKAIVTREIPTVLPEPLWQRVGNTGYYAYFMRSSNATQAH